MVIQTDTVRIREGNNNKAYFINASFTETIFTVWKMPKKITRQGFRTWPSGVWSVCKSLMNQILLMYLVAKNHLKGPFVHFFQNLFISL